MSDETKTLILEAGHPDRVSAGVVKRYAEARRLGILKDGELSLCNVAHDDDCQATEGGACTCDPWLHVTTDAGEWLHRGQGWRKLR